MSSTRRWGSRRWKTNSDISFYVLSRWWPCKLGYVSVVFFQVGVIPDCFFHFFKGVMFGCFFPVRLSGFFKGVMSECFFFSEVMSGFFSKRVMSECFFSVGLCLFFFSRGLCLGVSFFQWGCLSSNWDTQHIPLLVSLDVSRLHGTRHQIHIVTLDTMIRHSCLQCFMNKGQVHVLPLVACGQAVYCVSVHCVRYLQPGPLVWHTAQVNQR